MKSCSHSKINTHVPPSKKLQTLSSRFETRWNVSRIICCWTSSAYSTWHNKVNQRPEISASISFMAYRQAEYRYVTVYVTMIHINQPIAVIVSLSIHCQYIYIRWYMIAKESVTIHYISDHFDMITPYLEPSSLFILSASTITPHFP